MKIVAVTRALNEAQNIGNFCENYGWADQILITDGGSDDGTQKIAGQYPNVEVMDVSHLQIPLPNSPYNFITPEPHQTNILIEWVLDNEADWIIRDDCDCWSNPALQKEARRLMETVTEPSLFVYRLYLWGADRYFPKFNEAGQSLWAWRPDRVVIRCDESDPLVNGLNGVPLDHERHNLEPPLVCLHHCYPDEETVQRKAANQTAKGKTWVHPLESIYAPPKPLPDWVYV